MSWMSVMLATSKHINELASVWMGGLFPNNRAKRVVAALFFALMVVGAKDQKQCCQYVIICILDVVYPSRTVYKVDISRAEIEKLRKAKKSDDEQELINDDIVDDAEQRPDSEAEKNSPSDTSEDDKEKEKKAGGDENKTDKQEVRKRRPRKAD